MSILINRHTKVICQGLALFWLFSTSAYADAKSAIEEAVAVCAASIMRPLTFPEMAKGTGYGLAAAIEISATQKAQSFSKGERSVSINELTFSDASTKSCLMTLTDPFSLDDVKALKTRIEADPDIGKLDGEAGSPKAPGMAMNMHFGTFKRPGANPIITVNVFATDRITTITFSRTDFKAKD
jgi:hypothetical protein